MKKALLIGSEGNIGKPLTNYLKHRGFEVKECDLRPAWRENYYVADINHPIDLLPAFDWGPDVVFLLSAIVSRVTCEQAAGLAVSTNLSGINNVLQLCKRANAFLVFFSTSEVYGPQCDPMDECVSDPRPDNNSDSANCSARNWLNIEDRRFRPTGRLHPTLHDVRREGFGDHRSAMIRFAYNLALGKPIEVHQGSARGWLHVSDAIAAIEAAMRVREYAVINIGHPDVRPIQDLAEMIRSRLGAAKHLIRISDLPHQMTLIKRPSLQRMRDVLQENEPKIDLARGVERVCARVQERISGRGIVRAA